MKTPRFEIFRGRKNRLWRWRLRSRNGRIVARSDFYTRKDSAWRGAFAAAATMRSARFVEAR